MTVNILTWFWKQERSRFEYTARHVNEWANMVRDNVTRDVTISCVTDHPEGVEDWINIIEPPRDFCDIKASTWSVTRGLPQCFRRLAMFSPDAEKVFGKRIMAMDLDCLVVGNIDHLVDRAEDFIMFRGTSKARPYNGSLIIMDAGARPQVYTDFTVKKAEAAGKVYVGSDQAWISYCLGKGEVRVGEKEGVYSYGPRFVRIHGGENFFPPSNLCLLFFPGTVKVFKGQAWQASKQDIEVVKRCLVPKMLAYDDPKGWGKMFVKANPKSFLVDSAKKVGTGDKVFVRLDQQGKQRGISKNFLAECVKRGADTLPTAQEGEWYDEKIKQLPVLEKWMPKTWVVTNRAEAAALTEKISFPIISKSTDGAGSGAVRILESADDAKAEIKAAFSRQGMKSIYDRRQKGYVYWQEIVSGNDRDYRVIIAGPYLFGLVRRNKKGTIFASGSGDNYPLTLATDRERDAARLAVEIAKEIGTKWMAFDFVFRNEAPLVLEMSSAWTQKPYDRCQMFRHDLTPASRDAAGVFEVAGCILAGVQEDLAKRMSWRNNKGKVVNIAPDDKRRRIYEKSDRWELVACQ